MAKDLICPKCGQRATYAKDPKTMEPTSFLVCWECGKNCESCRCKGNVKLQKFGIEVEEKVVEDVEPIPSDTVVEEKRSEVAALATRPGRRTSPPSRRRAKGDKLERPKLEAF